MKKTSSEVSLQKGIKLEMDSIVDEDARNSAYDSVAIKASQSEISLIHKRTNNILYGVDDCPPWYTCLVLGIQHFLLMVESTVSIPYLLTPLMCIGLADPNRGYVTSTIIFVSGLVTLLQSTFGVRLPIIQGGSHTFISPILAILSLMPCPSEEELSLLTPQEREDVWQLRMRTIQGSICGAAIFQIIVGMTGAVGVLLKWVSPLTITPTITLIGLSLFKITATKLATNWLISSFTVFLLVLFSQYLAKVEVPWISCSKFKVKKSKIYIFQMFPVLFALMISWLLCFILTKCEVLDEDDEARTDLRTNMIYESSWFRIPYPGQFGVPILTVSGVVSILAGVVSSIIESIGDYYACARLAEASHPPMHSMNRGIFVEGVGTVLAGLFGTGSGTTSFSQNIAAVGITGVGSRRVIQFAGLVMMVCGIFGKVGAIFINIPEPIIGGIFVVVFSMISSVGISNLQFVNLNSSRNLFVLGISLFAGLTIPEWVSRPESRDAIQTSIPLLDELIFVLLKIPMFLGGVIGFVLDNTIPGSKEERGLLAWEAEINSFKGDQTKNEPEVNTYDFPFGMDFVRRMKWTKWIPICPTFKGWNNLKKGKKSSGKEDETRKTRL